MATDIHQTYSHAEAALASRGDVRVTNNVWVVKFIEHIVSRRRNDGHRRLGLLMRHSLFEEGGGEAYDGEEGNDEETGHG